MMSITSRLTIWFTASMTLILACASLFLFASLKSSLHYESVTILRDRVQAIQTVLDRHEGGIDALKRRVESEWPSYHFEKIYVQVLDDSGHVITESPNAPSDLWRSQASVADGRPKVIEKNESLTVLEVVDHVRAPLPLDLNRSRLWTVDLAMDLEPQEKVIRSYKIRLITTLIAGLILALFVGRFIAKRGLKPVVHMAETLGAIDPDGLGQRISGNLPVELRKLGETFNELLRKIETSIEKLTRFSSDLAHEMRTPINNLRGEVEVALSRSRTIEEYQEVLGSSLEECSRMKSIVDSLLFLARAEDRNPKLKRFDLNIAREIREIVEFHEITAAEGGVELRIEVPPESGLTADRTLFQTAIGNLLSNSLRYTPRGGSIQIRAQEDPAGFVLVSVSDTGVGIAPEHLPFVFDRLYRADQQRSSEGKEHFGLGLAIVQAIMKIHRGTAAISSQPGRGTTVTLRFPVV